MQVSLAAAKSKLAAEEAAKSDSKDPKRAKTRGSISAEEAAKAGAGAAGGAAKKGAVKKKGDADGALSIPGVDPATLEAYQNALSAAAVCVCVHMHMHTHTQIYICIHLHIHAIFRSKSTPRPTRRSCQRPRAWTGANSRRARH
jgi:hypothetical protein